jgi:uncharacterized protein
VKGLDTQNRVHENQPSQNGDKIQPVTFEWDEAKAAANPAKHGVAFDEAKTVFDDPLYIDFYDPEHSVDEPRYIIIGTSRQGRLLIVA